MKILMFLLFVCQISFAIYPPIHKIPACYKIIIDIMDSPEIPLQYATHPLAVPTTNLRNLLRTGWVKRTFDLNNIDANYADESDLSSDEIHKLFNKTINSNKPLEIENVLEHSQRVKKAVEYLSKGNTWLEDELWRMQIYALIHDLPEGDPKVGDILPDDTAKRAIKDELELIAMLELRTKYSVDSELHQTLMSLFIEYEDFKYDPTFAPARLINELDKADAIVQAIYYKLLGNDALKEFYQSNILRVNTEKIKIVIDELIQNAVQIGPEALFKTYYEKLSEVELTPYEI